MDTDRIHTNRQRIIKIKNALEASRTATTNADFSILSPFIQHEMDNLQLSLEQAESCLEGLNEFLELRSALDNIE